MLSLRRCIQRHSAKRNSILYRQWSTLSSSTYNNDEDTTNNNKIPNTSKVTATSYTNNNSTKRHFSISRHPDPLQQHGTINKLDDPDDDVVPLTPIDGLGGTKALYTADDLDTYEEQIDGNKQIGSSKDSNSTSPLSEFWNDELEEAGLNAGKGGSSDDYANLFDGAFGSSSNNNDDDDDEQTKADKAYTAKQLAIQEELDKRTGRLWTDEWIITDEEWMTDELYDDIEEWKVNKFVTRKAMESVIVYSPPSNSTTTSSVNGVPNLLDLSKLSVPKSLPSHPGHGTPIKYANYRKKQITKKLHTSIQLAIHDDLIKILSMDSYDEKQVAVDALYEGIVDTMSKRERVLSKLPNFHILVEEGLEKVLIMVQGSLMKDGKKKKVEEVATAEEKEEEVDLLAVENGKEEDKTDASVKAVKAKEETNVEDIIDVMGVNNKVPTPVFMDILAAANSLKLPTTASSDATSGDGDEDSDAKEEGNQQQQVISKFFTESNKDDIPNLLYPLNVHKAEGVGRMVEEWQLAANKETKRIMIRDVMVDIASKIVDAANCCEDGDEGEKKQGAARVFVSGKRGVGKTAALAGIVASARISGHIVVYHPDGDRLRKHGYYIDPCNHRKGLYNLPEIAKEFCQELLTSHGEDVASLPAVSRDGMKEYLTDDQIRRVFKRAYADDESVTEEDTTKMNELSLDKVLTVGIGSSSLSSGCYCTVINQLMNQTEKPFTVVMDEFNCYYDHGHYFHMEYDEHVRMGVPPNRISIFKPFMDAMGLYPEESGVDITDKYATDSKKALMKWGSIVVGTSESRAVKQSFTQSLEECAQKAQPLREGEDGVHAVEVRRFDNTEVQHQLYNYEIIGIGKLRFDRGETSLNPEEVEYLRLVSGGSGQHLMNACMIPSS